MGNNTRRNFFSRISALAAFLTSARLSAQQTPAANPGLAAPAPGPGTDAPRRSGGQHHIQDGIYYISGTGANDGYPKDDHVLSFRETKSSSRKAIVTRLTTKSARPVRS